jgi:hypothetical protein
VTPRLSIGVIWQDDDLVEIEAAACTEHFSGLTQVYTTYDELRKLRVSLVGFPKTASSRVAFSAGETDSYSFLGVDFYCIDHAGHAAVQITIESNVPTNGRPQQKQRVRLEMQFEPVALDEFLSTLNRLISARAGNAILNGIGEYTRNIEIKT